MVCDLDLETNTYLSKPSSCWTLDGLTTKEVRVYERDREIQKDGQADVILSRLERSMNSKETGPWILLRKTKGALRWYQYNPFRHLGGKKRKLGKELD